MVRCKFRVFEIKRNETSDWDPETKKSVPGTLTTVCLLPVSGDGENAIFGKATPAGQISLGIRNQAAADFFQLGKAYYFDATRAD
jgi:hypothetical protein